MLWVSEQLFGSTRFTRASTQFLESHNNHVEQEDRAVRRFTTSFTTNSTEDQIILFSHLLGLQLNAFPSIASDIADPPGKPHLTRGEGDSVCLVWDPPLYDGHTHIEGYMIETSNIGKYNPHRKVKISQYVI